MDKSENLELRQKLAKAAGWSWQTHANGLEVESGYAYDGKQMRLVDLNFRGRLSWDDVMAVAEAVVVRKIEINTSPGLCSVLANGYFLGEGRSPDSLARAIIAALEARKEEHE